MATMNAFTGSAFNAVSLSGTIDKKPFIPGLLGSLNLATAMPVSTHDMFVDRRESTLSLISTSALDAPPEELQRRGRDAVTLRAVRLAKGFTLSAASVMAIRGFGKETELEAAAVEFLGEMGRVRDDMELTEEHHRLGMIQGILLDADGSTVIYNYFNEFGETDEAAVSFALSTATTDVSAKCKEITRGMQRSSLGSFTPATRVHAIVGDGFYDALVSHPNVEKFYMSWQAAASLREAAGAPFQSFTFGQITWHNYQGTDDNTTVAVPADEAKFFPVGARNFFQKAQAPHTTFGFVNTKGRPVYAEREYEKPYNIADSKYVKGTVYGYPLYFCQRPGALRKATKG